jgi:hypothetical protein
VPTVPAARFLSAAGTRDAIGCPPSNATGSIKALSRAGGEDASRSMAASGETVHSVQEPTKRTRGSAVGRSTIRYSRDAPFRKIPFASEGPVTTQRTLSRSATASLSGDCAIAARSRR